MPAPSDKVGRARVAVGIGLVLFLVALVVFYGAKAPPPPPSDEEADAWMAAQDAVPETDVEAMATGAAAVVAAAQDGKGRIAAQLSEMHKIGQLLQDRQTGGGSALLDAAAAVAAAKNKQTGKPPPLFNAWPWRRPLTDQESPVQVVAVLGIEGSRHEVVRDWLVSAAVTSGRHVIPTTSLWDALVKKKAGAVRDHLSNVTTQMMHQGEVAPAASVLVLAEPWPARLLQRELPDDCGADFSRCEAAIVQQGLYDAAFLAAAAAPVAQFRAIVLDREFADCVAEHLSWDHTHAAHARLLARYKTHLARSVERTLANKPWAYVATNQMLSAAARETLLDF